MCDWGFDYKIVKLKDIFKNGELLIPMDKLLCVRYSYGTPNYHDETMEITYHIFSKLIPKDKYPGINNMAFAVHYYIFEDIDKTDEEKIELLKHFSDVEAYILN